MKTKVHPSPIQLIASLFTMCGLSLVYLGTIFNYGTVDDFKVFAILINCFGWGFFVASGVLYVIMIAKKRLSKGDEFTSMVMKRAGFVSFIVLLYSVPIIMMAFVMIKNPSARVDGGFMIDARMIFAAMVGVAIVATFLFTLLVFIFSRKGERQ